MSTDAGTAPYRRSVAPGLPDARATTSPPGFETTTSARWSLVPETRGVTLKLVRSGVMSSLSMCAVGTGSIHTVCQMPDAPV